jgi:methionine-rich copper-binding protein CopC
MTRALRVITALWALMLVGLWPQVTRGHAFPERAEPRVGATVAIAPTHVRIWFDGPLEPAFSTLRVEDASGRPVDQGDGHVDPADATRLEASLPPLSPGIYRVIWRVVARDGHRTEGNYTFTLRPGE